MLSLQSFADSQEQRQDQQAIAQDEAQQETTDGILEAVTPYTLQFSTLVSRLMNNLLRYFYNVSLPCTIGDFMQMEIKCTPI